jgi:hypothetical protein
LALTSIVSKKNIDQDVTHMMGTEPALVAWTPALSWSNQRSLNDWKDLNAPSRSL